MPYIPATIPIYIYIYYNYIYLYIYIHIYIYIPIISDYHRLSLYILMAVKKMPRFQVLMRELRLQADPISSLYHAGSGLTKGETRKERPVEQCGFHWDLTKTNAGWSNRNWDFVWTDILLFNLLQWWFKSTEMPRWNSTSKSPAKTDDVGCDSGPTGSRDWCILRQGWSGCTPLSWQTYDVVVDFAANAALFVVEATPSDKSVLKWGNPRTYIPKWYRKISQKGGKVRSHRHFDKLHSYTFLSMTNERTYHTQRGI